MRVRKKPLSVKEPVTGDELTGLFELVQKKRGDHQTVKVKASLMRRLLVEFQAMAADYENT